MKELPRGSPRPEDLSKKRSVLKKAAMRFLPVSTLVFAACSGGGGGEKNNTQELETKASSGYALPFPEGETWFLTTGPHGDGFSKGIKYAIDIAPPEGGFCPPDGRKFTIDNRVVTASASGEIIIKGDDKNRNDPFHSIVDIKDNNGLTQRYVHLDNTKVKLGDKVKQGGPLGNPSCEFPPGGGNTGPHLHIGLMKDGQAIPIDEAVVGGWTIHNGVDGKDGTMTKPGEKTRTANIGRYGENSAGIRNDLPNNSNKAVVALPKDPIPPISGSIKEKSVAGTPAPDPTKKAIEVSRPTSTPEVQPGWIKYTSTKEPFRVNHPRNWLVGRGIFDDRDIISNQNQNARVMIFHTEVKPWIHLEEYKNTLLNELKDVFSAKILNIQKFNFKGYEAYEISAVREEVKDIYTVFMGKGSGWIINAEADDATVWNRNFATLKSIVDSFEVLKE